MNPMVVCEFIPNLSEEIELLYYPLGKPIESLRYDSSLR